jgi:hypothetical protein
MFIPWWVLIGAALLIWYALASAEERVEELKQHSDDMEGELDELREKVEEDSEGEWDDSNWDDHGLD